MALKDAGALRQLIKNAKSFDQVFKNLNILSLSLGKCRAEITVEDSHLNPMGGLHGGFSATLVDVVSSYALMTQMENPHVSVNIHTSYLKGAVEGDQIVIDAKVTKTGKSLAFLEVELTNKATGDLLVRGSHTKFILSGNFADKVV